MKELISEHIKRLEGNLVIAKILEKPKCKPWDLVKGKRFRCCHSRVVEGHSRWCLNGITTIAVPKIKLL